MRGGAAHVELANGRAITGPASDRPQKEKLFERKLALKDVAFGEACLALDIERGDELLADDDVFYVWRVFGDGVDHGVAERLALLIPCAVAQFVRRVLNKAGKDVFAGRRDRWVGKRGNHHINIGAARVFAVLGQSIDVRQVVDSGRYRNRVGQVASRTLKASE